MKVVAISSPDRAATVLFECQQLGYFVFMYDHADLAHQLLADKFLYVHDDAELMEKIQLLKLDITAQDLVRL